MATDAAATPAVILRSRLRKYFLVVGAMIGGAFGLLVLVATIVKTAGLEPRTADQVLGAASVLSMFGVVGGSWFAVYKLWRCPACDKNIYWLVSWNMSVFASAAKSHCTCGAELFPVAGQKRQVRRLLVLVGIAVAFGLAGAMASGYLAQKRRSAQTQEQPLPPG